ncbi:unnamed protein product, partial [Amoebophrya sp. A25]
SNLHQVPNSAVKSKAGLGAASGARVGEINAPMDHSRSTKKSAETAASEASVASSGGTLAAYGGFAGVSSVGARAVVPRRNLQDSTAPSSRTEKDRTVPRGGTNADTMSAQLGSSGASNGHANPPVASSAIES